MQFLDHFVSRDRQYLVPLSTSFRRVNARGGLRAHAVLRSRYTFAVPGELCRLVTVESKRRAPGSPPVVGEPGRATTSVNEVIFSGNDSPYDDGG